MDRKRATQSFVLVLLTFAARSAIAMTYTVTLLSPPAGYNESAVSGISASQQAGYYFNVITSYRAAYWNGASDSIVDLHPADYFDTVASDTTGNVQVGYGLRASFGGAPHALLWRGTAESVVDLNPNGFLYSQAYAASDERQVGFGYRDDQVSRALMWRGTAESVVDLHPTGYDTSHASDVNGSYQVGSAYAFNTVRAMLWHDTAESAIDLHPPAYALSVATAVSDGQQVGRAIIDDPFPFLYHAILWSGSAESAVDLTPLGFLTTYATGVARGIQVGAGSGPATAGQTHALRWNGTSESVLDLHQFLEGLPVTMVHSGATNIHSNGTIVGTAIDENDRSYAVLWTPVVPEPSSCALVVCGLVATALLARRNRPR